MHRLALVAIAVTATARAAAAAPAPLAIGAPGGPARAIALTDDGELAVSADRSGHLRLWPALDGTREPVAVAANPAASLAVARDDHDLAIAGLDTAGELELVRVDGGGTAASRAPLDAGGTAVAIAAAGDRLIAQRDDGAIALFDLHRKRTGVLSPSRGEHVDSVVARGGAALVLVTTARGVRARWIDLAASRWGDETPVLPIAAGPAALSPDRAHLAAAAPSRKGVGTRVVIVDLATGQAGARPEPPSLSADEDLAAAGFVDADTLVMRYDAYLAWWRATPAHADNLDVNGVVAIADHHLAMSQGSELELATPDGPRYLGYRVAAVRAVRAVRGGLLITGDGAIALVDDDLRGSRMLDPGVTAQALVAIDEHRGLAVVHDRGGDAIDAVDFDHPAEPIEAHRGEIRGLAYERSTRIAAWLERGTLELAHVDARDALSAPVAVPGGPYASFVLLDPARARGDVAVALRTDQRTTILVPVTRFTDRGEIAVGDEVRGDGARWAAQLADGDLRPLGLDARPPAAPPDGTLTAEVDGSRLTLRAGGHARWTAIVPRLTGVVWTTGGDLIAVGDGIARVDLATGALLERRLGWGFGLTAQAGATTAASIVDAP